MSGDGAHSEQVGGRCRNPLEGSASPLQIEHAGPVLHRILAWFVDRLPFRQPANLFLGGRLHFCMGSSGHAEAAPSVRTLEWNGRQIAHGHHPFPSDEWEGRWPTDQ